jgi:hypothetical protein
MSAKLDALLQDLSAALEEKDIDTSCTSLDDVRRLFYVGEDIIQSNGLLTLSHEVGHEEFYEPEDEETVTLVVPIVEVGVEDEEETGLVYLFQYAKEDGQYVTFLDVDYDNSEAYDHYGQDDEIDELEEED